MTANNIPVAIINPDAPPESLEAKQPPVDNGAECYSKDGFSRDYMAREWEKMWTRTWLIAGVVADLPEVGDYFLFDIREEFIIVTRTEEGVGRFITSAAIAVRAWSSRNGATRRFSSAPSTAGASTTTVNCAASPTRRPSRAR